ncbi:MAG: potassium channel family protein [Bacillota bacterium]|nr:potassium channel family protein [Bacillota bacterium]
MSKVQQLPPLAPSARRLTLLREFMASATVAFNAGAVLAIAWPQGWVTLALGALAVLSALGLITSAFLEIVNGAGCHGEAGFRRPFAPLRRLHLVPSLSGAVEVLLLVLFSIGGLVLGFAAIYVSISLRYPQAFNQALKGWNAFYYSAVTLATVGYGDIHPTSWYTQALTILEIVLGYIITAVMVATLVGWLLSVAQSGEVTNSAGPGREGSAGGPLQSTPSPGEEGESPFRAPDPEE